MSDLGQMHRIVQPLPASVRMIWPGEATHFTPWLAENLDWLEPLELGPLELLGVEVLLPTVSRNLDILARTPDGRRIAIENQFRKVDHDHLTRGLAYALGLGAHALVVIAEDHASEFVAIADYLNSAFEKLGNDEGIAVFLVKLTVEQVGDSFVPRFSILARPNSWLTAVHAAEGLGQPTIAAFIEATVPEARENAQEIVRAWSMRSDATIRVNPKSASIALDYAYSSDNTPRSLYILYNSGSLTVQRGYLIERGPFKDGEVAELDSALQEHFPTIDDKPYYPKVMNPNPEGLKAFADWIAELTEVEAHQATV